MVINIKIIVILVIFIQNSQSDPYFDNFPKEFSWDNYEGRSLITQMQSQKSPHSCGSCWAMASAQALSDRIKINKFMMRKKSEKNNTEYLITDSETILSSQILLSCDNLQAYGCFGGQIKEVYKWIKQNNITDETCSPYLAQGERLESDRKCNSTTYCSSCDLQTSECNPINGYKYYEVEDHGFISGEENMMKEIFSRGPIVCYMRTDQFYDFKYHKGIYIDISGSNSTDHAVSILGWGEEKNQTSNQTIKYWVIRNTYGSFWGDQGFMKILKGQNNAGIEQECVWATPKISQFQDQKVENTTVYLDWRNVNGTNFVSPLRNLLTPKNCNNVSWAEAGLSSLEDRINIQKYFRNEEYKIPIRLSLQSVINCLNNGKCSNSSQLTPKDVYKMAIEIGIPDDSCNSFEGDVQLEDTLDNCKGITQCKYCYLPHYPFQKMDDNCTSLPSDFQYPKFYATSISQVHLNETYLIKKEIEQNGPISCKISIKQSFIKYNLGIYSLDDDLEDQFEIQNHWITLIGWGFDNNKSQEFWIAKNNWGSAWGECGFFRLKTTFINTDNFICIYPNLKQIKSQY